MSDEMEPDHAKGLAVLRGLEFCGCGCSAQAYSALLEALQVHDGGKGRPQTWEQRCTASREWARRLCGDVEGPGPGYDYLILYFLDAANLIWHGSNVTGCWLSDRGKAVVAFLEAYGTEPDNWPATDREVLK